MSGSRGLPLTYDQWVRRATLDAVPPNSDGLLHVGERAALIEQLSYLKKRNAQLMKQQRAVLLAACEAQAAHAQCADFAGELMREKVLSEQRAAERGGRGDDAASVASDAASTASGAAGKRGKKIFGVRVPSMRKRDKPATGGEYEASSAAGDDAAGDGDPAAGAAGRNDESSCSSEVVATPAALALAGGAPARGSLPFRQYSSVRRPAPAVHGG